MSLASKRGVGLGRGLSALLDDMPRGAVTDEAGVSVEGLRTVSLADIAPHPGQPRRHFDETALDELAQSIAEKGILQPIIVRPHGSGYQIIAGERRWRAAQRAQLHEIPVIVRDLDETATFELALIENIQRQDLNAIEEADAYRRLISEFGHTQEALGKLVGKSRSHVANLMRLLDLPEPVRHAVAEGRLTMGHARALVTASDPVGLAADIEKRGLSVRDAEKLAKGARPQTPKGDAPIEYKSIDADIDALQRHLADLIGLKVTIQHQGRAGNVVLSYASLDQLDLICQRLSGERF
ncbi:ParB/RepB/Spo0J family partition protein [Sphingomonas naphthae]|uniref:ParB/RepB/Spo0J family partition protein n=1 Tax=Sphingomonas naphthae TaxID=1813468 RepID=A0ABY7TKN1_9SPHN|nr:ParB/RepB/Spo0J family partition protein [Sphingomonas naphthae]WCT73272.1 ParB/RepB/Spo0J family partition protein [Sphingomonas naphthae]